MPEVSDHTEQSDKKLTDWSNEPTLRDLKQDLDESKHYQQTKVANITEWLDNLHVRGSAAIKVREGSSSVQPKLIRKQAEWRYASLSEPFLSTPDLFNVKPKSWEDKEAAIQNQMVLNTQFNTQIDKVAFIDTMVRAGVDEGTVVCKVGWDFEEEEYEDDVPQYDYHYNEAMAEILQQMAEFSVSAPHELDQAPDELRAAFEVFQETGQPVEAVLTGYTTETLTRTIKNQPTVEILDYHNVYIDPTCQGNLDKASFVVVSFETSHAELVKDGRYQNLESIDISNNSVLGEPDHASANDSSKSFEFSDKPRKKFVVYEYWGYWDIDGTGRVLPIVAAWVGNTLIRMEHNPFPDKKLPFVVIPYLPVKRELYGEPDGALLIENQKISGAVTRGMIDILGRSANGQRGTRRDALDVTNRRKFEKGQDYEYNANVDPSMAFYTHTYPEIPASAQYMLHLQQSDAESMTGVKAFNEGINSGALGKVATGIRGALDAASKREMGILRRLSKGVVEIGRKIISMNQEFLDEEEIIRITNDEFVTVNRDGLVGEFDLELTISTAEDDNAKAEELAFMLQTVGPQEDPGMRKIILADICRLRKMPDLAKRIEEYEPEPDPVQQRKAEAEVALLEAEVMLEQAKAQKMMAEAQLLGAKVTTETVKADNIQSDTDQKNLNFIEQEAGVKQTRELEKQGEQARSQAQLKLLDMAAKQNPTSQV